MVLTYNGGSRDYTDRTFLEGRYGSPQAWVMLAWPGWDCEEWSILPDGSSFHEAIESAQRDNLPEDLYLYTENTGKRGDILWTMLSGPPVISQRFADVISSIGATGVTLVHTPVHPKRGEPVAGFYIVLFDNNDDDDIRPFPPDRHVGAMLDVSPRVMNALREAGVKDFTREDPAKTFADIEALPTVD